MSLNEITIDAPPTVVWSVLAEPPTYEDWVVGNKAIRSYEPNWPAPGTEFHHQVGFGPLSLRDKTISLEADPPRRLVMQVRAMPVGLGVVTFELEPEGYGTGVRMTEYLLGGPAKLLWPVLDKLTWVRNAETLRRLRRYAERRYRAVAAAADGDSR